MAILCAYYKSSDLLKPYLFKYLENNATDSKRPYNSLFAFFLNIYSSSLKII